MEGMDGSPRMVCAMTRGICWWADGGMGKLNSLLLVNCLTGVAGREV